MTNSNTENQRPRFSIIVPTYNRKEWVGTCLDAILAQTFTHFELVVVDDGSTDGTADWIRSQPRFADVILIEQENMGAGNARNRALKIASGEFFVFIDSDDVLLADHLQTASDHFAANPNLGMFCCDSTIIDDRGNTLFDGETWHSLMARHRGVTISTGTRTLLEMFVFSNCFPGTTFRRDAALSTGGFVQEVFPAEDYNFSLTAVGNGYECFYLHEPLCLRREHEQQGSGAAASVFTTKQILNVLERTIARNPELLKHKQQVRERFAQVRMDLAIAELKARRLGGVATLLRSLASRPAGVARLFEIGLGKLGVGRTKNG